MTLAEAFQRIVFLAGAGSSIDAGCKLSSGMLISLDKAIQALDASQPQYVKFADDFGQIYKFVLASLNYQNAMRGSSTVEGPAVNIEDFVMVLNQLIDKEFVVPYPLIGNWNDKIIKWELRNDDIFIQFKSFIVRQLLSDWTKFDPTLASTMLKPLRELISSSEDVQLNFFTLNYDLVFETTFNSPEARLLETGFSERNESGGKKKYWAATFDDEQSLTKINLYKLHGSVDWEYDTETDEISIKDVGKDGDPLIIFGSHSKMLSFDPFLYMLSKFRDLLESATLFVVIGYSFHDKYINNLLIQQLRNDTEAGTAKKLLIVDPCYKDKSEVEFTEQLKAIQDSKSINDVINFKQISHDRVRLLPIGTSEFYRQFFSDKAKLLVEELEEVEAGERKFG